MDIIQSTSNLEDKTTAYQKIDEMQRVSRSFLSKYQHLNDQLVPKKYEIFSVGYDTGGPIRVIVSDYKYLRFNRASSFKKVEELFPKTYYMPQGNKIAKYQVEVKLQVIPLTF